MKLITTLLLASLRRLTWWAAAKAASVAVSSPVAQSKDTLPGASGQICSARAVLDEIRAVVPLDDYVLGVLSETELVVDPARVSSPPLLPR